MGLFGHISVKPSMLFGTWSLPQPCIHLSKFNERIKVWCLRPAVRKFKNHMTKHRRMIIKRKQLKKRLVIVKKHMNGTVRLGSTHDNFHTSLILHSLSWLAEVRRCSPKSYRCIPFQIRKTGHQGALESQEGHCPSDAPLHWFLSIYWSKNSPPMMVRNSWRGQSWMQPKLRSPVKMIHLKINKPGWSIRFRIWLQDKVYPWSYANLDQLELFLNDRILDGSFKPCFPFHPEFSSLGALRHQMQWGRFIMWMEPADQAWPWGKHKGQQCVILQDQNVPICFEILWKVFGCIAAI